MSNIGQFSITQTGYVDLATATGVEFGVDTTFVAQNRGSIPFIVVEKDTTPTNEGFNVNPGEKFTWTKEDGINLYIKSNLTTALTPMVINIASK